MARRDMDPLPKPRSTASTGLITRQGLPAATSSNTPFRGRNNGFRIIEAGGSSLPGEGRWLYSEDHENCEEKATCP